MKKTMNQMGLGLLIIGLLFSTRVYSKDKKSKKGISDKQTLKVLKKLNKRIKKLEKEAGKKNRFSAYKFSGRVYVDSAIYSEDKTELKNGTQLTSVRLGVGGKVISNFSFKIKVDVKNQKSSLKDAYIKYKAQDYSIIVGHQFRPTGLQNWMSSKHTAFLSGSFSNIAFDHGGNIGITLNMGNDFYTFNTGIFAGGVGKSDEEDPFGLAGRLAIVPYKDQDLLFHLGAHIVYEEKKKSVDFDSALETNVEEAKLVSTGKLETTNSYATMGVEAAMAYHNFFILGEYYLAKLNKTDDPTAVEFDYEFSGYYVDAGIFLTGERRSYGGGGFGGWTPNSSLSNGGFGAFELVARYSTIDLNDDAHPVGFQVFGGEATSTSFGINWSPEKEVRLLVSYTASDITYMNNSLKNESPSVIQTRFQIGF